MSDVWLQTVLRLGVAVVAGGAIGWERQLSGRPAGLRTHMLVSLGCALLILIPLGTGIADTTRVIQGVATGIGFLCAGDIFRQRREGKERVKGLTSAASLWVTAGIGLVAGAGQWPVVVVGTGMTVLVLAAKRLEPRRKKPSAPPEEGSAPDA